MRRAFQGAVVAAAIAGSLPAFAQDAPRNLPTGGRSLLMGNTGIALGRDGSAPFLNPATIGSIEDTKLAFSMNVYRLTLNNLAHFFQPSQALAPPFSGLSVDRGDYLDDELDVLPSTLCFFFTLGNGPRLEEGVARAGRQKLALCFGETFIDDFSTTATNVSGRSPTLSTLESISVSQRLRKASIGPTYGLALTDHLSVGASLHGTLTTRRVQWRATTLSADAAGHAISTTLLDDAIGTSFEITGLFGMTYRAQQATFGAALTAPAIHVYGVSKVSTDSQIAGTASDVTNSLGARGSFSATPPMRLDVGAGFSSPNSVVEFDVGVSVPTGSAFNATLAGTSSVVAGGVATMTPYEADITLPSRPALSIAGGFERRFASGYGVLGGANADLALVSTPVPAQAGFHDYAGHQNRIGISIGGETIGDGGELLVGAALSYGFGPRYAPDVYSLAPSFVVVPSDSVSIMLVVAGAANVKTLQRAFDDVRSFVVDGAAGPPAATKP